MIGVCAVSLHISISFLKIDGIKKISDFIENNNYVSYTKKRIIILRFWNTWQFKTKCSTYLLQTRILDVIWSNVLQIYICTYISFFTSSWY